MFLSPDPDPGNEIKPLTQNGFNYVSNNPVMLYDPDGNYAIPVEGGTCYTCRAISKKYNIKLKVYKQIMPWGVGSLKTQVIGTTLPLTNKQATDLAKYLGFRLERGVKVHGELVFTNGKTFITADNTSHIGGIWKQAKSIKDLKKDKRMGTYDALLNYLKK